VSDEPQIKPFKLFAQLPWHLANHDRIHMTLATQGISNHICFPWMIVYLQIIILDEL
jgi:hypothetical protein